MSDTNENTPMPGDSLPNTSQLPPPIARNTISNANEPHLVDPSNQTTYEKRLYMNSCAPKDGLIHSVLVSSLRSSR
ncbi:hypothetical protein BO83DRAFT_376397 [Aspergillus eucalypticola CBS 122712]|uniref:Uncharacterized protein n=1 Tax=Aspergillus eucalypticola (strain CBS 122712 / IBT 29274) TaxID=1448314 RepID=A0A317W3W9_ASPEC|nr:uncharacterized protein BO83DRAFT_376397 [Aspergillus eucalypticola CBS 122712]PWY78860.1 hypothetical protein BO83DRAFT_376397 [Aspergillus eucalypticola CBS 122712]